MPHAAVDIPKLDAIRVRRLGPGGGHFWEQMVLPGAVKGGLISLCNTGPIAVRKHIVCIHDVNTRLVPKSYSRAFRTFYRFLIPAIGRSAERIATVSAYSQRKLHHFGIAEPRKTLVIGNGHEHALDWVPVHSDKTRAVAGPNTIVAIGAGAPHKNVALLVGMAGELTQAGFKLALVGAKDARIFGEAPGSGSGRRGPLARPTDRKRNGSPAPGQHVSCVPFDRRGIWPSPHRSHGSRLSHGGLEPIVPAGNLRRCGALRCPVTA